MRYNYLNSNVVRMIPAEGVSQHLVDGFGDAVKNNVHNRRRRAIAVTVEFDVSRTA